MITVLNVANASPVELLCLTYELFLDTLKEVQISQGEAQRAKLEKVREILISLTENLDTEVPLAQDLFKLYIYIQGLLVTPKPVHLEEAYTLMETIYKGYQAIRDKGVEAQKSMMSNTQNVYAGMTYGKGYLEEVAMDQESRGYNV